MPTSQGPLPRTNRPPPPSFGRQTSPELACIACSSAPGPAPSDPLIQLLEKQQSPADVFGAKHALERGAADRMGPHSDAT